MARALEIPVDWYKLPKNILWMTPGHAPNAFFLTLSTQPKKLFITNDMKVCTHFIVIQEDNFPFQGLKTKWLSLPFLLYLLRLQFRESSSSHLSPIHLFHAKSQVSPEDKNNIEPF